MHFHFPNKSMSRENNKDLIENKIQVLKAPLSAALTIKVLIVVSSSFAKLGDFITAVIWFNANLKQNSSNSCNGK